MIAGINGNSDAWKDGYWERLEEVEEMTGLDFSDSIDDIEREDMRAPAAMERQRYSINGDIYERNVLKLGSDFDYLDPPVKDHVLSHEGIHALDFDNQLIPQLRSSRGISNNMAHRISVLKDRGRAEKEGVTQAINKRVSTDSGSQYVYPGETRMAEDFLEQGELDLDSELLEEIDELEREIVDRYSEIEKEISGPGLYLQQGVVEDQDYSIMVLGEAAEVYGPRIAEEYISQKDEYSQLEELTDIGYDEFLNTDLDQYDF